MVKSFIGHPDGLHNSKVDWHQKVGDKEDKELDTKDDGHADIEGRLVMKEIHAKKAADAASEDRYGKERCFGSPPRLPLGLLFVYKEIYKSQKINTYDVKNYYSQNV